MEALHLARAGAFVLNELFQPMGNMATRFVGDDAGMWTVQLPARVVCHPLGRKAAELEFNIGHDGRILDVYVVVDDIYGVVRSGHLADFDPGQYGFTVNSRVDWKGEKEPDLIVTMTLSEVDIPGMALPLLQVPQTPRFTQPKIRGSFRR